MYLTPDQHRSTARALVDAERTTAWIEPVSNTYDPIDIADAYQIALAVRDLKVADGHRVKGHKVGLTSRAMRELANADEPDYGLVYDDWFLPEGSTISRSRLNRPLVEQEIAFVLKHRLQGPSINAADVIQATDFVLPALEIVDSRFTAGGRVMLIDSVADAAMCGRVVLGGRPVQLSSVDIRRIGGSLSINGEIAQTGTAAAVLNSPVNAVAWLANKLAEFGDTLEAGEVILSGSFIRAMPFDAGDVIHAMFDQLGEVSITVER